ncbi:ABC transporter ATP-binding protein [Paenibacillus sp. ATY16]|uniref:ABC transporter ATP-binding protein n=1 Tax=Paenibacillus sp. ATY16 TaxID=1759312 RepID=UPI00200C9DE6|nr:ABC transporter ATP-binding protein [Paenibacillus sp. ATY16]MCK9859662.1 ABC transporter ATP-binding protein [Paenibacillus sp. ATY16]
MIKVDQVGKSYKKGGLFSRERQKVLQNISFQYKQGECLGIIGESGCGKSTLGRLLLGLEKPDSGSVQLEGSISAVFQDYTSSINPYFTVEEAIMEPLQMKAGSRRTHDSKINGLLEHVGLDPACRSKYPLELSGGQIQRVCIARAIATEAPCIVLDEAISSLDGSVQMQVLELLKKLKETDKLGYIFITHDIRAAAFLCDRVMIMKEGQIEEIVSVEHLKDVQSPYAKKMLQMMLA